MDNTQIEKEIRRLLVKCMSGIKDFDAKKIEVIDVDDNLIEYGMDSIMYVKLTVDIESTFDFELPMDNLIMDSVVTIASLCDMVNTNN